MAESTHYPAYDVWEQHEAWDSHTRQIVARRRASAVAHRFLTPEEALLFQAAASVLIDDLRLEVLTFITQHVDESLASPIGESQRKVGLPKKPALYRSGLAGLDELAKSVHGVPFAALEREKQHEVLKRMETGETESAPSFQQVPPRDFFKEMLRDVVGAYYSHPLVWSDIGYGGPAYPRGYVRVEKGLVDPWEAKRDGTS